ncbi:MAG: hypothetical protein PVJ67_02810 [Candidatus Pacearchaeota archaeon]|jgi:hypothetical protein
MKGITIKMKGITINMTNRVYITLVSLALVLILGLGVYAYGTSDPAVFGHSSGELEGASIPSGAVMAFNAVSCPSGWSAFSSADGRVVVGLDGSQTEFDTLGKIGGENTHTLTVSEIPSHRHSIPAAAAASASGSLVTPGFSSNGVRYSNYAGGGQAHNNLQPYITLLYCIKD